MQVEQIRAIAPRAMAGIVGPVAEALEKYWPKYGIDTPLRQAHFMAQACTETDGFRTLEEYASGKAYEGRKDLGNIHAGDGVRYKGRGIFQCTGWTNYDAYGRKLRIDLLSNPERAADPEVSVRIACEYWKAKGLNAWADRDDVAQITRRINGGTNGLSSRRAYLKKAKVVLGADNSTPLGFAALPSEVVPDAPIAATPPKGMLKSKEGWASLSIGGVTAVDVGNYVHEHVLDKLDAPTLLENAHTLLSYQEVRIGALVSVLAVAMWYWRHQRMYEQ